jgi:RNase P subunit RPR2
MKNKLNKQEVEKEINEIFSKSPNKEQIKKAKKLAMNKSIKLGNLKKRFCKKCYSLFSSKNSETRIRKGFKRIKCKNCNQIKRYKLK